MTENRKKYLIQEIVTMIEQGKSDHYLITFLKSKRVSADEAETLRREAAEVFFGRMISNARTIVNMHNQRYNMIIDRLLEVEELPFEDSQPVVDEHGTLHLPKITLQQWRDSRMRKIKAMDELMNTLMQQENLLALVERENRIDINHDVIVSSSSNSLNDYDLSKLTHEEAVEMLNLMKKAAGKNIEQPGITARVEDACRKEETATTVDQPANITLIQHEKPQPPAASELTGREKLQAALKKLAAKKLNEAGANLDDSEKALLDNS